MRRRPVVLAIRVAALLLLAVAFGSRFVAGFSDPLEVTLAFTVLIAVGECSRIGLPAPHGIAADPVEQAPLGAAGALAYALLGPLRGLPTTHGVFQVLAVVGFGVLLGLLVGVLRGAAWSVALDALARRVLTVAFAATIFQPLYAGGILDRLPLAGPAYGLFLVSVAALAAVCDAILASALRTAGPGPGFGAVLQEELRALPGIGSAIVATGMLISLAAGEIGLWALPLFGAPLLFTQASFRRAEGIRATYGQTIATLARATEVAGYTLPGHSRRVADTACAIGRELALSGRELALLEYAALMHDIGQLSLVEPVPGGATVLLPAAEQQRIARLGSEVIRRTGVPPEVAQQVARSADPFRPLDAGARGAVAHPGADAGAVSGAVGSAGGGRRPGKAGKAQRSAGQGPALPARIIRVANAYDDLVSDDPGPARRLEVLAQLRLGTGSAYDAHVVEALARASAKAAG